ncbi:MAG TPA: hypothetical protein PK668_21035 [Myxococcota bacterium]|nr:hypothetical protein [Myxococcota bacterium]HRY95960.1 hypothetical protein [Myxococcota bacterium]HSA22590.1 hypothetical protein [Myxococcota bacterium]
MARHGWDYFQHRWNVLQDAQIAENQKGIVNLEGQVVLLERTLVYVLAKGALGQPIGLEDPVLAEFLHLKDVADPRRALLELVSRLKGVDKERLVTCPTCGAKIRDIPGVLDEVCSWCGQQIRTQS